MGEAQSKQRPQPQTQSQKQVSSQRQIQDQNYSNHIMMSLFSTLEAISLCINNGDRSAKNKVYGHYDRVDYSKKSFKELLLQMQTLLTVFHASVKGMKKDHKQGFVFPKNFSREVAIDEVKQLKERCRKDATVLNFCRDFESLLKGQLDGLTYDRYKLDSGESEKDRLKARGSLFSHGIHAQSEMEKRRQQVQKMRVKNAQSLEVEIKARKTIKDSNRQEETLARHSSQKQINRNRQQDRRESEDSCKSTTKSQKVQVPRSTNDQDDGCQIY